MSDGSRDAIAPGDRGNRLQLHRDIPNAWDAWDIDEHYRRTMQEIDGVEEIRLESKPEEAAVVVVRSFGASRIEQRLALAAGSPSLEITNIIDWHEQQKLLKLGFELDVHADRSAAEIQFGHVFRPTHTNTSWELARFEICGHRFLYLGEPGYGVAVTNDSTYGHDVSRRTRTDGGTTTTVRESLLRAPLYPDPGADQGRHVLRTTVRPGAGMAQAVEEGYRTNLPLRYVAGDHQVAPLVTVSNDSTYGHDVSRRTRQDGGTTTTVRESLLRAPLYPDPHADQGRHVLRTTVRPGAGLPQAVEEGYRTNLPLRYVAGDHQVAPLVTVSNPGVVVEAVKLAEDGSGDLVVRLYESLGGRARATVTAAAEIGSVEATDLLERPLPEGAASDGPSIDLELRPFQLVTLRFRG